MLRMADEANNRQIPVSPSAADNSAEVSDRCAVYDCSHRTCSGWPVPPKASGKEAEKGKKTPERIQCFGVPTWQQQERRPIPPHFPPLCEVSLLFPHLAVQTPVSHRVSDADGGEQIARGSDADAISMVDCLTLSPVEGHSLGIPCFQAQRDLQLIRCGDHSELE